MNNSTVSDPLGAKAIIDQLTNKREVWLRQHSDARKIVGGPDLKQLEASLTCHRPIIGQKVEISFRLAKPYRELDRVRLTVTMLRRIDESSANEWGFEGSLVNEQEDKLACCRRVVGRYSTDLRNGIVVFSPRER